MKKLILLALVTAVIISCNKGKGDTAACVTDAASISGSYKITAYTYKAGPQFPEIDYMNDIFPSFCDRDNIYKFTSNGTYQIMDIGIVCSPTGDDTGTWQFLSTAALKIDGDEVILESFDCKTLVLVNTDTQQQGDRLKIVMSRQ